VLRIAQMGARARTTSRTDMNEQSSRSHCIFILTLLQLLSDGST
jgi:hypothetical protein